MDSTTPISPEKYQEFRDRLSSLLEKAHGMPGLLPQSSRQMEVARRKLFENQFEITLVGEFQGGKSTTFNNLCDGREISPRGKGGGGLKTSGCIIRAQNLSNQDEEEHALVRWRTPEELLKGFDQVLQRSAHFRASAKVSPNTNSAHGATVELEKLDLTTRAGRDRIWQLAKAEVAVWEQNPAYYDPDGVGLIDVIRFALLTAHFVAHPSIEELRKRQRFAVDAIQPLVTFPEDWESRWARWDPAEFRFEEVLFAFVASVDCRLHSPNLARLGCAITDCPGLFASNWDSQVATEALSRADAVLYLVPGDKALGLGDLKSIRSLTLGKGMIMVGANCRALPWTQTERVLAANSQLLSRQGLGIEPANVHRYHAALALFARQLGRGVAGLDQLSISSLRADFRLAENSDNTALQQQLAKRIRRFWEALDPDFDGEFSPSRAGEAYEQSRMPQLLDSVERFVLAKKAETILLGNGSRVLHALGETEASLKLTEENAQKRLEEREAEFKIAENELVGFEKIAEPLINEFGKGAPQLLAESFWEQLEGGMEIFTEKLAKKLAERIKQIPVKQWLDPKPLVSELLAQAQRELDDWLKSEAQLWLAEIMAGQNNIYSATLERPMRTLHRELSTHWDHVVQKQIPGLEGIIIPRREKLRPGGGITLPEEFLQTISELLAKIRGQMAKAFVGLLLALVVGALITVFTLGLGFGLIAPLIACLPEWEYLLKGGEGPLRKKLQENFKELESPIKEQVAKEVGELVMGFRQGLTDDMIAHPRNVYQQRKVDSEKQFQFAEADRLRIAAEAKEAREKHVTPLRAECEIFLAEAQPMFPHEKD